MLRIEGYGDTPGERGTGYARDLQTWKQEVIHHFVFTGDTGWMNSGWVLM